MDWASILDIATDGSGMHSLHSGVDFTESHRGYAHAPRLCRLVEYPMQI